MAVPAGPPILLLLSLRAVVLGVCRSLPPLSSHSLFIVSLRMVDDCETGDDKRVSRKVGHARGLLIRSVRTPTCSVIVQQS
jgi:hypothetical protein